MATSQLEGPHPIRGQVHQKLDDAHDRHGFGYRQIIPPMGIQVRQRSRSLLQRFCWCLQEGMSLLSLVAQAYSSRSRSSSRMAFLRRTLPTSQLSASRRLKNSKTQPRLQLRLLRTFTNLDKIHRIFRGLALVVRCCPSFQVDIDSM